ncbi:DUF6165 family protein [Arenibaculum pallidiluteum]|uniref:DUF6165 family protein n=1 Tax=Arenibaculum pallidiluteum TaxID=2812559 RepID=UPI001A962C3B|nr:DUF6165 family protein [Arenibaculum pallidiluteum]
MGIQIEVAPGELIDKLSILEIKLERIGDEAKRRNVAIEFDILTRALEESVEDSQALNALRAELKSINEALWVIEDEIRECERAKDFGPEFIRLARAVYHTNDRRAEVKRQINDLLGSEIREEKSYAPYDPSGPGA